ncbi:MAG: hypothetical protein RLZZ488_2366 [Pseudomonadota bacterium]|jgi:hypothetical protein
MTKTTLSIVCLLSFPAAAMDWQFRSGALLAGEGGLLSGSKVPITSTSQREYDEESAKNGLSKSAREKIRTSRLRGLEGYTSGTIAMGYEGYSNDLRWQSSLDLKASGGFGNSSGRFFSPAFDPVVPAQGRGGRNSGWLAGGEGELHWIPFNGFSTHLSASFSAGSNLLKEPFSRLLISPEAEIRADKFEITPAFLWQRLLGSDALPAADLSAWSVNVEWLGTKGFRIQNPRGYPTLRVWRALAQGSPLLVTAMENEGRFFEINITPKILFSGGFSLISHFRSVSGSEQSYIAPSLAAEINRRGKEFNTWQPPSASADYSSQTIEWRNSLNKKIDRNWNIYATIHFTSQSNSFSQTATSNLRYSDLIDVARESTFRYFLGSEFLL